MGFQDVRQVGSHLMLHNPEKNATVTIPVHARKIILPKTLQSILKQAGIDADELRRIL